MDIRNRRVLIFGGWGLVGSAICRALLAEQPAKLVVCSLSEQEAKDAVSQLHLEFPSTKTEILYESGNIFVRWESRYLSRHDLLNDDTHRRRLLDDVLSPLDDDILHSSFIHRVLDRHRHRRRELRHGPGLPGHLRQQPRGLTGTRCLRRRPRPAEAPLLHRAQSRNAQAQGKTLRSSAGGH